ncbi:MAG: type II toxin-antitoxin system RelE/ParE family toxin [Bacteroidota bacterium]|nr:type II toxin-antitoxin system RelE/ParE family toxin [Bacteroidota bacterium]
MVKFKIEWSVEARLDLIDILEFYINQNDSATYSIKLNSEINKSVKLISRNPFIGIPTDYDSVRAFVKGDYQIIYEIVGKLILVIMIWDCRRDPEDRVIERRIK